MRPLRALASIALVLPAFAATPPAQKYVQAVGSSPLRAPGIAAFCPGGNYTLEAWVYLNEVSTGWSYVMGKPVDGGADPYHAFVVQLAPGNRIVMTGSDGQPGHDIFTQSTGTIPPGQWTHLAVAMAPGVTRIYLNGILDTTGFNFSPPPNQATVPFSLGLGYFSNGQPYHNAFPGYLRSVRFWSLTRNASQIAAAQGEAKPSDSTGLIAAWLLDEAPGATTALDASGNHYDLAVAAGTVSAQRASIMEAQPFFSFNTTSVLDGSLQYINPAGTLIDFNSDGKLDLVLAQGYTPQVPPYTTARLRAFTLQGGTYVDTTDAVLGNVGMYAPTRSLVADFNGDGRPDVLVTGLGPDVPPWPGEQSRLFLEDASGHLADVTATNLPQHPFNTHDAAVGDVDGDGRPDFYLCNVTSNDPNNSPRIYLNNGAGAFTETTGRLPADIANGTSIHTTALFLDVNEDGHADLVLGGTASSSAPDEVLLNDGHGYFSRPASPLLPARIFGSDGTVLRIVSADLNGDGQPDLVLSTTRYYNQGALQILLRQRDGMFADVTAAAGLDWTGVSVILPIEAKDINGDGRPDLVMVCSMGTAQPQVRVLLNKGDASFVDASSIFPTVPAPSGLGVADVDGDGLVDIAYPFGVGVVLAKAVKALSVPIFYDGPLINTQPASQTAPAGSPVTLQVSASAGSTPAYQWQLNGVDIPGATEASYSLGAADFLQAGTYTVRITNGDGAILSLPAQVALTANFEYWVQTHFSLAERADPALSGASAVYGRDGIPNLVKYATGLDPHENVTSPGWALNAGVGEWIFTYSRPADRTDVAYAVEISTNLQKWATSGVIHERVSATDGVETWRGRYPIGPAAVFFRLRIDH